MTANLVQFVHVADRTLVFWDRNARQTVEDYLNSIDPNYFLRMVENGDKELPSDLLLRQAYFQSMETLFALVASFLQARQYPVGWMLSYKSHELYDVIGRINEGKQIKVSLIPNHPKWLGIVQAMIVNQHVSFENHKESIQENAATLEFLSREFLDEKFRDEYNSIKHGMRALPYADQIAIFKDINGSGPGTVSSITAQHGSSFRVPIKLRKFQDYTLHTVKKVNVYWNVKTMMNRLGFIRDWLFNLQGILSAFANPGIDFELLLPQPKFCNSCRLAMSSVPYFEIGGESHGVDKVKWLEGLSIDERFQMWP